MYVGEAVQVMVGVFVYVAVADDVMVGIIEVGGTGVSVGVKVMVGVGCATAFCELMSKIIPRQ